MIYRNIPDRITDKYSKMTKSEKIIANLFLKQSGTLELSTIAELAEICGVADSTVFRFCRLLGYSGYNDFKLALAKEQGSVMREGLQQGAYDIYSSIALEDDVSVTGQKLVAMYTAALRQTLELLESQNVEKAAHILHDAGCVYCLGQGGSLVTAMEAWVRFMTISKKFMTIEDTHLQVITASMMTESDIIWFFSYSGSTKDMVEILASAHARGVKIILVTRYAKSPATQYADVVLICGSNESPLQSGTIVAKIAQLFVIDMVYQEYVRLDSETSERNRDIAVSAIANRML